MKDLKKMILTRKTAFTIDEIRQIFSDVSENTLKVALYRAKLNGDLLNPYKGIRTLPVYDEKELACKLKKNSYISLESVLYDAGAIFQAYFNTKTCIAESSADLTIGGINYRYTKVKESLLYNDTYVRQYENYRIATPERALCDYVYLFPNAGIDAPEVFHSPNSDAKFKVLFPFYPKATQEKIKKLIDMTGYKVFKY
ncbi:hypothetical protein IJM86_09290 [bacterium]|nr:hypothetical protein [bacterium]